jgi:hypothetical protein
VDARTRGLARRRNCRAAAPSLLAQAEVDTCSTMKIASNRIRVSMVVVMFAAVVAAATSLVSCGGGGGDGGSNGGICDQCGETDGPCLGADIDASSPEREQALCPSPGPPCHIDADQLQCLRRLGTAQRVCFPISIDPLFECDGERAGSTPTLTATPVPSATVTPTSTAATPTSTAPTATGVTATPTGATPTTAATPSTETVGFAVDSDAFDDTTAVSGLTFTATYQASAGHFQQNGCSSQDVSASITSTDNGSGSLTVTVGAFSSDDLSFEIDCDFDLVTGDIGDANVGVSSVSDTRFTVDAD